MTLDHILNPKKNNFDLLRLIAALMVIYGHGPAFVANANNTDMVAHWLGFDYSGSLAVKFFFMLSGLLVTASLISKPFLGEFLIKRAMRIFPGLVACLCITVFIVGSVFTKLSIIDYFFQKQTWNYLIHTTFLYPIEWLLPGVFSDSKYGVNGSLWTLPLEVICYLFLAAFYGAGIWRNRWLANVVLSAVMFISFFMPQFLPPLFGGNKEANLLPGCFALGAIFATNQQLINVNRQGFLALGLLTALLWATGLKLVLFYVFFFYGCIYIASNRHIVEKLKIPADPSYGVYIYGFVVQQSLAHLFPNNGLLFNQVLSSITALFLGVLSWYLIEKPCIQLTRRVLLQKNVTSFFKEAMLPQKGGLIGLATKNSLLSVMGLIFIALIVHFVALYFIYPGYYAPTSFQHSDFYIPAAFAYAPGEYYSFGSLLSWPRPLLMWYSKFSGYFGHNGSVALIILVVFLNCALVALLAKRMLCLTSNFYFYICFVLYCYLLFTQPYFYTFYTHDVGSHLSFLLLLIGIWGFIGLSDQKNLYSFLFILFFSSVALLIKETYALSMLFIALIWFAYYFRVNAVKASVPGIAFVLAGCISAGVSFKTKSVFVNANAEQGSAYHMDFSIVSIIKEMSHYLGQAITPIVFIMMIVLAFATYKFYKEKLFFYCILICFAFASLAWLPNALLPFHHYEGYSFNGLYVGFAMIFFAAKLIQDYSKATKIVWIILMLSLISPLSSIKRYHSDKNLWVLQQEQIQVNMLAGFKKAAAQLQPLDKNMNVLISGISSPFHPFAFPESIRSFAGGNKAVYYFIVPKEYPNNVGKTQDLVHFIAENDRASVSYDQEWIFDESGKLQNIEIKAN